MDSTRILTHFHLDLNFFRAALQQHRQTLFGFDLPVDVDAHVHVYFNANHCGNNYNKKDFHFWYYFF